MKKIKILPIALLAGLTVGLLPASLSQARTVRPYTGEIYVSPSHTSVEKGHDFTVGVRINPGTSIDSVQTILYYSTSQLEFVSSAPSSTFTCTKNSGGGGSVQLVCIILGSSTSSDSLISNVTFKALAGSGNGSLSLASSGTGNSNSNAASSGTWTNPSVSGGSVSFTSPSSGGGGSTSGTSSSNSTSSTSSGSSGSTSSSSSKPNPVKKLTVSADSVKPQLSTASVSANTNISAAVFAQFSTSQSNLNQRTVKSSSGTNHTLSFNGLTPGATYYYLIVAQSPDGQTAKTSISSFMTKGYTLSITVLDSHNQPLAHQTVTLHSTPMATTTNTEGVATFYNVEPGVHHLDYTSNGQNYSQTVYVDNSAATSGNEQTAPIQNAAVIFSGLNHVTTSKAGKSSNKTSLVELIIIIILLLLWAITFNKVIIAKAIELKSSIGTKKHQALPNFTSTIHQPKK